MTNFDVIESYADDFTKWRIENTGVTSTQKKIVIAAGTELKYNVIYKGFGNSIAEFDINGIVKNKVTIKITGLNNVKDKLALEYGYFTTDSKYIKTVTLIDKDGVYTYDLNDIVIPEGSNIAHTIYNNKYNEQTIYPGDKQDTDTLFIGNIRKDDSRSFIGCHGDILLFNRTLTEYEISWVKNNMMCSKQQEPDIDL